jgi:hypothetical protein
MHSFARGPQPLHFTYSHAGDHLSHTAVTESFGQKAARGSPRASRRLAAASSPAGPRPVRAPPQPHHVPSSQSVCVCGRVGRCGPGLSCRVASSNLPAAFGAYPARRPSTHEACPACCGARAPPWPCAVLGSPQQQAARSWWRAANARASIAGVRPTSGGSAWRRNSLRRSGRGRHHMEGKPAFMAGKGVLLFAPGGGPRRRGAA